MATRFDSFRRMLDVDNLRRCHIRSWGCGGRVGYPSLHLLAWMGIEQFSLIDFDVVELHNPYYDETDIGKPKVQVLAKKLKKFNSRITCNIINEKVTRNNIFDILDDTPGADVNSFSIDDIPVLSDLVRATHSKCPGVMTLQVAGQGAALAAFSHPGRTPCLGCLLGFANRRQASGGQAVPLHVGFLAEVASCYVVGLCLHRYRALGWELFRPYLDVTHPVGILRTAPVPGSPMPPRVPLFYELMNIVQGGQKLRGCSVCRGYSLKPL